MASLSQDLKIRSQLSRDVRGQHSGRGNSKCKGLRQGRGGREEEAGKLVRLKGYRHRRGGW